ncbi:MAG: bifunctional phosphopantothenoylcysteine decarboxylase/phosphopantothenate--cysteine ligase CoaBC [Solobacterium sp.]|nr:bifunctional phosphopantothenoylcysteine decarboxylase/phosphopantothenate--cysteine ligase CoaBC [Solobacterium sp.]
MTNKPCVLIGVTGGIAAYKICSLVSSLHKQDYEVHVLMTREAQEFITPLTMQSLSGQKVILDMFTTDYTPDVHHISLAQKADAFVIAPATANVIAKVANGIADDMLTTTFLASKCEKLIVPAMNTAMLENPITQDNLKKCEQYGMHILESGSGYLACGTTGKGRMPEPDQIEDALKEVLHTDKYLAGRKVLITAGPTCEAIDPVRYITNHSSGKMGYALARAARNAGAEVILVAGKTALADIRGVHMVPVTSAREMADAVLPRQQEMDIMILAAAVADYTPITTAEEKIHKADGGMNLELTRTTDILKTLGQNKRDGQILVGFSMETENLIPNSRRKLSSKNCDFIVANSLRQAGAGFAGDTNVVTVISEKETSELGLLSKDDTAEEILRIVAAEGL